MIRPSKTSFLIYGNQTMDLDERVQNLLLRLQNKEKDPPEIFHFNIEDFIERNLEKVNQTLTNFKNSCESVSFFSSKTIVVLKNLQSIPKKKSPLSTLEQSLSNIHFTHVIEEEHSRWIDMDSISIQNNNHHRITGKQIVQKIIHYGGKTYYLEILPDWKNRMVYRKRGKEDVAIEISELLKEKLKLNLLFTKPDQIPLQHAASGSKIIETLCEYIQTPPDQVTLIFTANIRNTKELENQIFSLLQKNAEVTKATVAYDDFRPIAWVIQKAQQKGIYFDRDTADLLIEIAGSEFYLLETELEKLSLYLQKDQQGLQEVTPEILFESISHSKRFGVFKISEFLTQKKLKESLQSLRDVLGESVSDAASVFGAITLQFRRLLRTAWMLEAGLDEKSIATKLKINPWFVKQFLPHMRHFTLQELENTLVFLSENDLTTKFSAKDSLALFENFCFLVCAHNFQSKRSLTLHWVPT